MKNRIAGSLLFLLLFAGPGSGQEEVDSSCVACHMGEAATDAWEKSVHAAADVSCHDCHGGDPNEWEEEASMDPAKGYIGDPPGVDIPAICARCHADAQRMEGTGLPTDQMAQFEDSIHGVALFEKELKSAPSCVDCHRTHDIRSADDPKSSIHKAEVAFTCGSCHEPVLEAFRSGPHFRMVSLKEHDATCTTCHENHATEEPTPALFDTCASCHEREIGPLEIARELRRLHEETQAAVEKTRAALSDARRAGWPLAENLQRDMTSVEREWLRFPAQTHAVEPSRFKLDPMRKRMRRIRARIQSRFQTLDERRWWLLPLWVFLLFWAGVLYKRRRLEERIDEETSDEA